MTQVGQLVTERVHQTRFLQQPPVLGVAQPDADHAVLVADAVPLGHTFALRLERGVAQPELRAELAAPALQLAHRLAILRLHPFAEGGVGGPQSGQLPTGLFEFGNSCVSRHRTSNYG